MRKLHIDVETFSPEPIKHGVARYVEHPDFQLLMLSYAFDDEDPVNVDFMNYEHLPDDVLEALLDPNVRKVAHNAAFELAVLKRHFSHRKYRLMHDPKYWECTLVGAAYLGLPLGLDKLSEVLQLSNAKDKAGKALIQFFCVPCRPTKTNGGRTRNLPIHDSVRWAQFRAYCDQDVRAEQEVDKFLDRFPRPSEAERLYWLQDQEINARGIMIDEPFIRAAIIANEEAVREVREEIKEITRLENPNSPGQLREWVGEHLGEPVASIAKGAIEDLLASEFTPQIVKRVLKLRGRASNTSASKYGTMLNYKNVDGRIRGLLQFYGANRTGRFAGRGVQVQNLKRTGKGNLDVAKEAVVSGAAALCYDDVSGLISKLIRTALIARPGYAFAVSDFAAIEARVLAWLAGEMWVLDVFRSHGMIYEATAAKMFGIPIEEVDSDQRGKGKVANLALGYQGALGALIQMGALRMGLQEEELPDIVKDWRKANPNIVKYWYDIERAAKLAIKDKRRIVLSRPFAKIIFTYERGYLFIELPSGRRLAYYGAALDREGKIFYWGMDQIKKIWCKINTYGGSLVENITQAIARDCLVEALYKMRKQNILMHIHDEIIDEVPQEIAEDRLALMNDIMKESPAWAPDLPLKGSGYVSTYYKKD